MKRAALGVIGLLCGLWAGAGAAQEDKPATDCPPAAQAPTPAQWQAAARSPRDRGFLWRISKGGHSSWLYGTLHLGRLEWAFPGPQVRAGLQASDRLALELDVSDPQVRERVARAAAAMPAPVLDDGLRQRIARQVAAACVPPALIDGQHPLMQALTLTVLAGRRDGLDPAYAQEAVLAGVAHAAQLPIEALETPELQMRALMPADAGAARQMLDELLGQLEQGSARATLARMAAAWERADLAELENYEGWCQCVADAADRELLRRLNDERNPPMAERIDRLHAAGARLFAAVGALHMTGPQSLPKLMAERGYTVERIGFDR